MSQPYPPSPDQYDSWSPRQPLLPPFQPPQGNTGNPQWQPPQYPPQAETYYPPQQPLPTRQFRHPAVSLPPAQPERRPQTPGRNRLKRVYITAFAAAVIVAAIIGVVFDHGSQPASTPTPITQATQLARQPISAPTSRATPQPTIRATSTPAILGGDIGAFVAKYGRPNDHSVPDAGYYHFQRYSGSNLDFLIVQVDAADGGGYAQRVEGVTAQAPDAGWSQQEASAACAEFLPRDAIYQRAVKLASGYDKVYSSASLAGLFPASAFTGPNSQVQAGLFDVQYINGSGTLIASCNILVGTQQTQL
jgi:hypothetical protein